MLRSYARTHALGGRQRTGLRLSCSMTRLSISSCRAMSDLSATNKDHTHTYTSGRWLYNEALRLSERRGRFDLDRLRTVVANAVGQRAGDIKYFEKLAEGGSHRVLQFTLSDGLKVIARLPYPCVVPQKYGTASEVATIEFLRLHGLPVPKVLAWSDDSSGPVQSEYIVLERVPGTELEQTWYTMSMKERMALVEKIVDIERMLFSLELPAHGSIYFHNSLPPEQGRVSINTAGKEGNVPRFCIGPSTEYLWWYQSRDELEAQNGPWSSSAEVLKAVGFRELEWLARFGKYRYPREPLYRSIYHNQMVDPGIQADNLSDYMKIVPFIAPSDPKLCRPCLRHPDLSPNNIFISDSGEITGIIDWQHSVILPRFLQARIPKHFQNYGDEESEEFKRPALPKGYENLSGNERMAADELYRRRQVHYFYVGHTSHNNPAHFAAMGTHNLVMRNRLYNAAKRPWEGDNTSLKAELIRFIQCWHENDAEPASKTLPVQYTDSEIKACLAIDEEQRAAVASMQTIRDNIGINIEGWVPNEGYDQAVIKAEKIKQQILDAADTEDERDEIERNWPFQDHEEID